MGRSVLQVMLALLFSATAVVAEKTCEGDACPFKVNAMLQTTNMAVDHSSQSGHSTQPGGDEEIEESVVTKAKTISVRPQDYEQSMSANCRVYVNGVENWNGTLVAYINGVKPNGQKIPQGVARGAHPITDQIKALPPAARAKFEGQYLLMIHGKGNHDGVADENQAVTFEFYPFHQMPAIEVGTCLPSKALKFETDATSHDAMNPLVLSNLDNNQGLSAYLVKEHGVGYKDLTCAMIAGWQQCGLISACKTKGNQCCPCSCSPSSLLHSSGKRAKPAKEIIDKLKEVIDQKTSH